MKFMSSLCVALLTVPLFAADKPKEHVPSVIDPAKADADFAVQGEYFAEDAQVKVGVQIIALGHGKFRIVGYGNRGLPGNDWKKGDDRSEVEVTGETANGVTTLKKDKDLATVKDGVLTLLGSATSGNLPLKHIIRKSPTEGAKAPQGAVILFDGKNADEWQGGRGMDGDLLCQGATSKRKFQSYTMHVEFMLPYEPDRFGQDRGNSGVYQQGRYEVQVLESFGLEGKNNECGGIYEIKEPSVNMCFPPLSWQTYDIDYAAAQYDGAGKKIAHAKISVKHNGVTIHDGTEIPRATRAAPVKEGPEAGPIYLQDHGHPVRFRNIWLVEKQ